MALAADVKIVLSEGQGEGQQDSNGSHNERKSGRTHLEDSGISGSERMRLSEWTTASAPAQTPTPT